MDRIKNPWEEREKFKLWLFYAHNIPLRSISNYLERSVVSVNHALIRLNIRNKAIKKKKGPLIFPKRWTRDKIEELCMQVKVDTWNEDNKTHYKLMPSKIIPWQKSIKKKTNKKKLKGFTKKNFSNERVAISFYPLNYVINALRSYKVKVTPIQRKCPLNQSEMFKVNDDLLTAHQMIAFLNKIRSAQGLTYPIMVEGYTYEN